MAGKRQALKRRDSPDNDALVANYGEPSFLWKQAFVIATIVLSPSIGFCWRLILISLLFTYFYCLFMVHSFHPPDDRRVFSLDMARFIATTISQVVVLIGLVAWCISITPIHIFAPTFMDVWTPYAVHDALRMAEVMHDAGDEAAVDIFAIHGLGSRPESAWTYNSNATRVHWLSELLPQAEGFRNTRVVMINHQTRWDSNTAYMELHDYASELLDHIENQHKANPDRPIVFIAHSFGGLLLKKALLLAKSRSKNVAAMTRGIVFLGVPHRGSNAAFVASCLSCMAFFRGSSSTLLEFMSVDGLGILDLESEFYDAYVLQYHSHERQPYICDILEMRPERVGKLVLGSIVRPKQGLLRHGRVMTLDTDHRGLNKFQSSDDPNFQTFLKILWQAVDHALQTDYHPSLEPPPRVLDVEPPAEITVAAPDILDFMSYGMPWTMRNRIHAGLIGGLQELTASWLAGDIGKNGHYVTHRIPKTALYNSLIGVSIGQVLSWIVYKFFEGSTSVETRILQIILSHLTIVPVQNAIDLGALAVVAGARNWHQVRATVKVGLAPLTMLMWALSFAVIPFAYTSVVPQAWVMFFGTLLFSLITWVNTKTKKRRMEALRKKREREMEETWTPGSAQPPYFNDVLRMRYDHKFNDLIPPWRMNEPDRQDSSEEDQDGEWETVSEKVSAETPKSRTTLRRQGLGEENASRHAVFRPGVKGRPRQARRRSVAILPRSRHEFMATKQ